MTHSHLRSWNQSSLAPSASSLMSPKLILQNQRNRAKYHINQSEAKVSASKVPITFGRRFANSSPFETVFEQGVEIPKVSPPKKVRERQLYPKIFSCLFEFCRQAFRNFFLSANRRGRFGLVVESDCYVLPSFLMLPIPMEKDLLFILSVTV